MQAATRRAQQNLAQRKGRDIGASSADRPGWAGLG